MSATEPAHQGEASVNHHLCSLLHWLAGFPANETRRVYLSEFNAVVPEALAQGFVEYLDPCNTLNVCHAANNGDGNAPVHVEGCEGNCGGTYVCPDCGRLCGYCFGGAPDPRCDDCVVGLRLTELGREIAQEGLCAMEAAS
jgi:hypothetical protein